MPDLVQYDEPGAEPFRLSMQQLRDAARAGVEECARFAQAMRGLTEESWHRDAMRWPAEEEDVD